MILISFKKPFFFQHPLSCIHTQSLDVLEIHVYIRKCLPLGKMFLSQGRIRELLKRGSAIHFDFQKVGYTLQMRYFLNFRQNVLTKVGEGGFNPLDPPLFQYLLILVRIQHLPLVRRQAIPRYSVGVNFRKNESCVIVNRTVSLFNGCNWCRATTIHTCKIQHYYSLMFQQLYFKTFRIENKLLNGDPKEKKPRRISIFTTAKFNENILRASTDL